MHGAVQGINAEEARALVDRIANSAGFLKSPRIRELLQYITGCALENPPVPVTEQQIGVAIFHRPPRYDTSSDTIVRVQMSQLRKRLQHYFLTEGAAEVLVVEVPRGSYNAVFRPASQPSAEGESVPVAEVAPSRAEEISFSARRLIWVLSILCLILAAGCVWLLVQSARAREAYLDQPALRSLWSNLIQPGHHTSVVVADSTFGFLQDALGTPMDLETYQQHDPEQWLRGVQAPPDLAKAMLMLGYRQYTSIGDLTVARRILFLDPALQSQISVMFARSYNARVTAGDHLVLIGSQRSNPWVQLYLPRLTFYFDYDETARKAIVRNRAPRNGERDVYRIQGDGHKIQEGYAVVAFLPNPAHTGNTLILYGTDMEATEAVGQLVTNESELASVLSKVGGNGALPFFQVLFKTRRQGGAPQEIAPEAWRSNPR